MITLIILEFKKLHRSKVLYIVICTMFLFFLCSAIQGIRSAYSVERLMSDTLIYATFLIFPPLLSLLASYIISREYSDDTMKSLAMIPINTDKLIIAKLLASLIIGIMLSLFLFIVAILSGFAIHPNEITGMFVLKELGIYLLQAIGCSIIITPIVAFMAMTKNGYWLSVIFAELYSFAGFVAASSRFRFIYPISAVFGFSRAYPTSALEYLTCCMSILMCILIAGAILRFTRNSKLE